MASYRPIVRIDGAYHILPDADALAINAGSEAVPGLSFVGDPDTGISQPAPDTLDVSTNGNKKASFGPYDIAFTAEDRDATTAGGISLLAGSNIGGTTGIGGPVEITAGAGFSAGGIGVRGGSVRITGGALLPSSTGAGLAGPVIITGGANPAGGRGGAITMAGGAADGNAGGNVNIAGGRSGITTSSSVLGGVLNLFSGAGLAVADGSATNYAGGSGNVTLSSGIPGNTNGVSAIPAGNSGSVAISTPNGGNATAGTGNGGSAGHITVTAGKGGTSVGGTPGTDGNILFNSGATNLLTLSPSQANFAVALNFDAGTVATTRTNLGLGGAAVLNVGTTAGTVAAGDDARLSDAREWTAATVSQAEAEAGTATDRRAWTSQRVRQAIVAWWATAVTTIGTTVGRAFLNLTNPSAIRFVRINADNTVTARSDSEMRTDLGLGTAATTDINTSETDITAGRLVRNGDHGIGVPITVSDFDAISIGRNTNQRISTGFAPTNRPGGANYLSGIVLCHNVASDYETVIVGGASDSATGGALWIRNKLAGTWSATWRRILDSMSLTTTQISATADQILKVGDYGLGLMLPIVSTDLNGQTTPGTAFVVGSGTTNYPPDFGSSAAIVEVRSGSTNSSAGPHSTNARIIQRATKYSSSTAPFEAIRGYNGTTWTAWHYDYGVAATVADARTNLGLGTAATGTLTTTKTSATIGQVVKVGDYGLGVGQDVETSVNYNSKTVPGVYLIGASGASNAPVANACILHVMTGTVSANNDRIIQKAFTLDTVPVGYTRYFDGTTWTAWVFDLTNSLITTSGNRWGAIPYVDSGGNTPIGQTLRFQAADASADDYDWQLRATSATDGGLDFHRDDTTIVASVSNSGRFQVLSGSNASPSLARLDDLDTGVAFLGSDSMSLVTGGTARVTVGTSSVAASVPITVSGNTVLTTADKTSSIRSTTLGQVMKVGDYGLGVQPAVQTGPDWNTITTPGFHYIDSTGDSNGPTTGTSIKWNLLVMGEVASASIVQFAFATDVYNYIFYRTRLSGGSWSNWLRITMWGSSDFVSDRVMVSSGGNSISSSSITATQLGFLANVTSQVSFRVAVPATPTSTGIAGTWAADATHFYSCYATNTWRRVAHATW